MKLTVSKEDYLKAIAEAENEEEPVIAATIAGRGDTLLTFNVVHYSAVPGQALERPHPR